MTTSQAGLYTEVLGFSVSPPGNTQYGTPRTFSATVVNVATTSTAQSYNGNISFVDGNGKTLCATTVTSDQTLVGAALNTTTTDPTLQVAAINQIAALNGVTSLTAPVLNTLTAATVNDPTVEAELAAALGFTNLYPLKASAAALATCTTPYIPAGNYTNLNVALTNLMLGGQSVGVAGVPILNPLLTLSAFNFDVFKANTLIFGATPTVTLPGATTTILVGVNNTDNPPSILYLDVAQRALQLLDQHALRLLALTTDFLITITVPAATQPGSLPLVLSYSGTSNFNPAMSGQGASPTGPTLVVPAIVAVIASANPATPPAGTLTTITGTLTKPSGSTPPTGVVTLALNGNTYPAVVTPGSGATTTFTAAVPAPAIPSSVAGPYPVVVNYTPDSTAFAAPVPPFSFNLPVGPATTTITQTVTPTSAVLGSNLTVAGVIASSNGATPAGTLTITVASASGNTTSAFSVNGNAFSNVIPTPGTAGPYTVTSSFAPAPGNSLSPGSSAPTPITVTPGGGGLGATSITQTVTPTNPAANAPVTVAGTITSPLGTTPTGTLTITVIGTTGSPTQYTFPITGSIFTDVFPAPSTPGTYAVASTYIPAAGSNLAGSMSAPTAITVAPALATITEMVTPNPAGPGATVAVNGTVFNANGTPGVGTVRLSLAGAMVGSPVTLGPGGTFTTTLAAPCTAGTYVLTTTYTPTGGTSPTASLATNLAVVGGATLVTQTVTPTNPAGNAPVTVNGTITSPPGTTPTGTITITVTGANGNNTQYTFPVTGSTFTDMIPAPGAPGLYNVTTTFNPAAGSTLAGSTSVPTTLTVGLASSTITETVAPNPAASTAPVTVTGTVTNADGSPGTGIVQLYLNGASVGSPVTLRPGGTFTSIVTAPSAPGTYVLFTTYTPTGATSPTSSFSTNLVVGGGGSKTTALTISFGNGGQGLAFPNCLGDLNVTVNGSGTPPPTGDVTLSLAGGIYGSKSEVLGTVAFVNGRAVFQLESIKLQAAIHKRLFEQLSEGVKLHKTFDEVRADLDPLPKGVVALLPDTYVLTVKYPGDSMYGAASTNTHFVVDRLCLLVALRLVT
ncbi:g1945 [Coccomyxa viridis]|uniref:G1945 protein n=1 Tax=Coccomyxa viridis TaxID=1274662 RepID=A0ABP1FR45_9CHLO